MEPLGPTPILVRAIKQYFLICKLKILYGITPNITSSMKKTDPHLKEVNQNIEPKTLDGCEECLQMASDGYIYAVYD